MKLLANHTDFLEAHAGAYRLYLRRAGNATSIVRTAKICSVITTDWVSEENADRMQVRWLTSELQIQELLSLSLVTAWYHTSSVHFLNIYVYKH